MTMESTESPDGSITQLQKFDENTGLSQNIIVHTVDKIKPNPEKLAENGIDEGYECEVCAETFNKPNLLTLHMKSHTGQTRYKCALCSRHFIGNSELTEHMKMIHAGQIPYKCHVCTKGFNMKCELTEHMRNHINLEYPYKCDVCTISFSTRYLLNMHVNSRERLVCSVCKKVFCQKIALKSHEQKEHSICKICGIPFFQPETLSIHMQVRKPRCANCRQIFCSPAALANHKGAQKYNCTLSCHKTFCSKKHRALHIHAMQAFKCECSVCRKLFCGQNSLTNHLKLLKFKCPLCEKVFCETSVLTHHMETHLDRGSQQPQYHVAPSEMPLYMLNQVASPTLPHMAENQVTTSQQIPTMVENHVTSTSLPVMTEYQERKPSETNAQPQMSGEETEYHLEDVKGKSNYTITQPQMSDQETEYNLEDGKSEPDDTITQPQMSGLGTDDQLVIMKSEQDDTIDQPQMSGQETEYYPVDVNSEADETITQPQMSDREIEYHLEDVKSESDDPISQPQISGQETEYPTVKMEPDEIKGPISDYPMLSMDMKNEQDDDTITKPEMSRQETDYPIVLSMDVKSESDDTMSKPQMFSQESQCNMVNIKPEADVMCQREIGDQTVIDAVPTQPQLLNTTIPSTLPDINIHENTLFVDNAMGIVGPSENESNTSHTIQQSMCNSDTLNPASNIKTSSAKTPAVYGCVKCRMTFSTYVLLCQHLCVNQCEMSARDHPVSIPRPHPKTNDCDVCGKQFSSSQACTQHMRNHTNETHYPCVICGITGIRKLCDLIEHIKSHTPEKLYKCVVCSTGFNSHLLLTLHKAQSRQMCCPVCKHVCCTQESFSKHMQIHGCKCIQCGQMFSSSENLVQHITARKHKCTLCRKVVCTNMALTMHMKSHIKCNVCGKRMLNSKTLSHHKKYKCNKGKNGHKKYKCDKCHHVFCDFSSLLDHNAAPMINCTLCGKVLCNGQLPQHMETHTDTYHCNLCGKQFFDSSALSNHFTEQKYTCPICTQQLCSQSDLTQHLNMLKYKCPLCERVFCDTSVLIKHKETHSDTSIPTTVEMYQDV